MTERPDDARRRYDELYRRSLDDAEAFWLDAARRLDWTQAARSGPRAPRAADVRLVPRRADQPRDQCPRPARRRRSRRPGRADRARRARRSPELTYRQLLAEVERVAAGFAGLGIGKGDRVTIYMPTSAEAIVAMLATVRIGAIHSVVFAGFGAGRAGRPDRASGSRLVLTADVTYRKGKTSTCSRSSTTRWPPAAATSSTWSSCAGAPRRARRATASSTWDEFLRAGDGHDGGVADTGAEATSRPSSSPPPARPPSPSWPSTPTAATRSTSRDGRLGVRAAAGRDVWWSTSDIGWVVGHSYIVYAPLLAGCDDDRLRGRARLPGRRHPGRSSEREGVTGVFTSPTAVRLLMRYGEDVPRRHDLGALERVFCAGEVLNPPAWEWLQRTVFDDRVPVIDHMWQTETGGPIFGNPYGLALLPIKPGSAGIAAAGHRRRCRRPRRPAVRGVGEKGIMRIKRPFPGLIADALGRARALRRRLLGADPGRLLRRRRGPRSTRTATSGSPAAPTRSSRSPATGSGRSRSRRRSCAIRPSPRPASPAAPTSCAAR